ncbi:MAG: hypothetical protein MJY70_02820 [Bacteroidales bacterium]|nr:hypothetical protein [Bacteroidales bacterium]
MIAAGSLFTSCVTNTEPQGIKDIREAKANYLDALAELRKADAAVRNADAEYRKAETALKQAEAAVVEAAAKAAEIAVELEDAAVQAKIAEIKAQAEIAAVKAREDLAKAQDSLERTLRNLAAQSLELSTEEQEVITHYTTAYEEYLAAQKDVRVAEKNLYDTTYNYAGDNKVAVAKAKYEQDKALAEQSKAFWEEVLADAEEMSEEQIANYEEWVSKYEGLKAENDAFKYDLAEVDKGIALNDYENKAALDSFYGAIAAKQKAIAEAKKAGESFKLDFTGDKAFKLPKQEISTGSVVDAFKVAVGNIITTDNDYVKVVDNKKLAVKAVSSKEISKQIFGTDDASKASLAGIIDALQREMVITDQYVKDTAGIGALVAETLADYKATKDTLVAGRDAYEPYVKAKTAYNTTLADAKKKGEEASKAIDYLLKTIKNAQTQQSVTDQWNLTKGVKDSIETAIINYGKAVSDYFGKVVNDSVVTYEFDTKTRQEIAKKVALKDLTKDDFDSFKATNNISWRTVFVSDEHAITNMFNDPYNAEFYSYNVLLKSICVINDNVIKWWSGVNDIRSLSDWKVADWGITTRPAKAADAKTYYYASADKQFKTGSEVFNYDKLNEKKSAKETAYSNFYTKIYEHFWGVKFNTPADSLVINFNEKTYTDPYLLPDFTKDAGFFTPSKKDAGSIDWAKVGLKSNAELDVINEQLKQTSNGHEVNNLEVKKNGTRVDWTLYAKVLATAQFENEAKYYVENKEALEELAAIVADVEDAYDAAVAATKAGSSLADSLVTKLIGKPKKDVKATDSVSVVSKNVNNFISKDGKGTFNLAGEQKELAEKYLTAYAKTYSELEAERAEINVTIKDNNELCDIYDAYIKALAKLDQFKGRTPEQIFEAVQGYWYGYDTKDFWGRTVHVQGVLEKLQSNIAAAVTDIKTAEGNLAKLEAGYDPNQIDIESAQDNLARAQEALEVAEAKLAAAEAAYQQVLKNHGLAE